MFPTFDFSNILKFIARGILLTLRSPALLMGILAAIVTMECISLREIFSIDTWFTYFVSFAIQSFPQNDFTNTILYMFNISTFLTLFYTSINIIATILPGLLSFFAGYISFAISFKAAQAFRRTVKDIVG